MANLIAPTRVFPSGAGYLSQYGIAQLSTTDNFTKIHIKTNIPRETAGIMVTIEAVGFAYGAAQAIRSSWCLYQWQSALYSIGVSNVYPGLVAEAVYYSADNYVCLRGSAGSSYFTGFALNAYVNAGDGPGRPVSVLTWDWNNNAGNFY